MRKRDDTSRALARDALVRIDQDGAYANLVVPPMLDRCKLDDRDRRFVTELVYGATRMRRAVDTAIAPHARRELDPVVQAVLRLGAYQLHFPGVAPHAAVSTSVSVAPKRAQGFVNAVLRRVAEHGMPESVDHGARLSYPDWIVRRLCDDLGEQDALGALEAMNTAARPHQRADGYIQDPASGWVAGLVDAQPGHVVADLCAAPGGKATAIGHLVGTGIVVAADVRPARARVIADNAASTDTAGVVLPIIADGHAPPLRPGAFDRVLVDAPCSGLGVLHRRPDARWRVEPDSVPTLAANGWRLLHDAAPLVAPDGLLVYSVCTISRAETIDVGEWAVDQLEGFEPLPAPGGPWRAHGHGAILLPQTAGTDGMYVLRLRRS
ncbi:MAG: transcription antitermination factor NusB [Acidimicrobiales bacterium]|nr:transcription antitermination factor NusB [Acidimicrobiales bacterium]